ncbi:hypothetical protein [Mucilaginibacter psychrotolerans]|uniref:Redoxin domain-containing protein n=1 Tax=Mucilaginibacter psychrotolerans TaxID=1524096 RepID=A0A4Y8RZL2_9SPHI|nr:hypothetical protein [Mucilaginibacter psychrotolerans]TFF30398.1 hypothetical protein E2R66_27460 [Mucilaginibacter psychrotolerans]
MINKYTLLFIATSVASVIMIYSNRQRFIKEIQLSQQNTSELKDSLSVKNGTIEYLQKMLAINYKIGNPELVNLNLTEYTDKGNKRISKLMKDQRKKFVIRYSASGCNVCIDLIFKNKERLNEIKKKFDFLVFVDFQIFEDYIRWKRVSETNKNVYLIDKQTLPFDGFFEHNSYCFIVNQNLQANSFFIPRNEFKEQLDYYIVSQLRIQ